MVQPTVAILLSALGLAVLACGHDKPANDASSNDAENPATGAPSGHSRPTDDSLGTSMLPDDSTGSGSTGTGSSSNTGGGSNGSTKAH
jgi:hypothetical protein